MKKILLSLILVLSFASQPYAFNPLVVCGGQPVAVTNWANITLFINFESNDTTGTYDLQTTSCGTECEYSNGGLTYGTYSGDITIDEDPDSSGNYSYQYYNSDYITFAVTDGVEIDGTVSSISTPFTMTGANWIAGCWIFNIRENTGNYNQITLESDAGGELKLSIREDYVTEEYSTSGLGATVDTEYIVTVGWNFTNDTYSVWVNGNQVIYITDTFTGWDVDEIRVGNITDAYRTGKVKHIIVSDHYENLNSFGNATGYGE